MRPWPVYLMAAALPVSIAAANTAKAFVVLFALVAVVRAARSHSWPEALRQSHLLAAISIVLAVFALSIAWSTAPIGQAANAWLKHAKLLLIPACLLLLRTRREAAIAVGAFIAVEAFVMLSSWLLWSGVELPYAREARTSVGTVFSSYLDQGMLTALLAVLCWYLRDDFPTRHGRWIAAALAVAAVLNVGIALPGRSGQLGLLLMLGLVLWWSLSWRTRWVALVAPVVAVAAIGAVSQPFREGALRVVNESRAFGQGERNTSAGQRLEFWSRSVQILAERPLYGFGAGSWNTEYRRMAGERIIPNTVDVRNPHQEYLLWAVQLGIAGPLLLIAVFAALLRDARGFARREREALRAVLWLTAILCLLNSVLYDAVTGETFVLALGMLLALGAATGPATAPRQEAA
ncbi:MAG: O-antigen ligase family protein [Pseudomonadota bacterium]